MGQPVHWPRTQQCKPQRYGAHVLLSKQLQSYLLLLVAMRVVVVLVVLVALRPVLGERTREHPRQQLVAEERAGLNRQMRRESVPSCMRWEVRSQAVEKQLGHEIRKDLCAYSSVPATAATVLLERGGGLLAFDCNRFIMIMGRR